MKRRLPWVLFAAFCLLQWALPLSLIQRAQATLEQGTAYRFRTAPVDPADPFRGRYVALDFEAAQIEAPAPTRFASGARLWAPIAVGADGYARLDVPSDRIPATGDRLAVRVQWQDEGRLRVALPFDRYYLDEHRAPEAERLYRERAAPPRAGDEEDPRRPAYAVVRVRGGDALIETLVIDGMPVHERLRAPASGTPSVDLSPAAP